MIVLSLIKLGPKAKQMVLTLGKLGLNTMDMALSFERTLNGVIFKREIKRIETFDKKVYDK